MKERLDYYELKKKMVNEINSIKGELRAEIILLQAHVEFLIDEIIEILLETNFMRGTKSRLDLKLQLLSDLNWLPKEFSDDLKKLSTIRGFVAHRIDPYDEKTRNDIEQQFKQIKLIERCTSDILPSEESIQKHLRTVLELYFDILHYIYTEIYNMKEKNSITNHTIRDNYKFYRDREDVVIQFDEI